MNYIDILKNLVYICENGDEDGVIPDLTDSEIIAINWAIKELEK